MKKLLFSTSDMQCAAFSVRLVGRARGRRSWGGGVGGTTDRVRGARRGACCGPPQAVDVALGSLVRASS